MVRNSTDQGIASVQQGVRGLGVLAGFSARTGIPKIGLASMEDAVRIFEGYFRRRDANDLLTMLWTWQHADISANPKYSGDFAVALRAIRARAIVMPSETDLYFRVNQLEVELMPNAEQRSIPLIWGHAAAFGVNPADNAFIDTAIKELLSS